MKANPARTLMHPPNPAAQLREQLAEAKAAEAGCLTLAEIMQARLANTEMHGKPPIFIRAGHFVCTCS